ncbi:MAG: acyl-CoA synthetase [Acidimicrobiia bacterium]|nr:MAG: acyl-CoA synthetase [Acidimicrobiia bacterium]
MNLGEITSRGAWRNRYGDAIVDAETGRRLTFDLLNQRVNRLAGAFGELGIRRGERVAILSRNAAEFMEVFFAAAKTGLVAQPLNWRLATPELTRILEDGEPRALIYHEDFSPQVQELQRHVDLLHWIGFRPGEESVYEDLLARQPDEEPALAAGDDDPFFILYTGGTTGIPKGALHSHRSAFTAMVNQTVAERIAPTDVYLLTGQMFHIPVVLAMNYLAHARPVVLFNFEPGKALELIAEERISAFLAITTMLNYLLNHPRLASSDLSSLRLIMYGGGPMPEPLIREAIAQLGCDLLQGYGQTEGGTMTFLPPWVHRDAIAGTNPHRLLSCGLEAHLTTVRVVDEAGRLVPRDGKSVGEIVVRSEANMIRYWRRPEETATTLRDGWMWTGDLATWDEDGFIYIVDRKKEMIISGGENIYPAQVEAAIYRHPAVLECAVIGVPDDTWGESVKAIVVLKSGMSATEQDIIDVVKSQLASYMKPRSVDFVPSLPKGPTGKILKQELRAPYWEGRARSV